MVIWSGFVGFLEQMLLWFAVLTGSVGFGIAIFTVIARLVILPLTLSSIRSSRKMQELQPMIKELQRKHGKDQQKLQEETLKLYREYKINPVGGCFPLLLQLPIFFGVYQAVIHLMIPDQRQYLGAAAKVAIEQSDPSLLFAQPSLGWLWRILPEQNVADVHDLLLRPFLGLDLGQAPWGDSGFSGPIYLILPVLSVVLQFAQQLMATPRVQDPQQKAMTQAMMFMPLVFAYIAFTFPSGAVLYWVVSSLVGVVQQYFTSGWGSLANYLKFLPADQRPTPSLAMASVGSGNTAVSVSSVSSGEELAPPVRRGFWDVLQPLTEMDAQSSSVLDDVEAVVEEAKDKKPRPSRAEPNPRRPRRRR